METTKNKRRSQDEAPRVAAQHVRKTDGEDADAGDDYDNARLAAQRARGRELEQEEPLLPNNPCGQHENCVECRAEDACEWFRTPDPRNPFIDDPHPALPITGCFPVDGCGTACAAGTVCEVFVYAGDNCVWRCDGSSTGEQIACGYTVSLCVSAGEE